MTLNSQNLVHKMKNFAKKVRSGTIPDNDFDDFVEVEWLQLESVKDPWEGPLRIVREDDDLQTTGEEGLVKHCLLDQIVQGLVLAFLPVKNFLKEFVVRVTPILSRVLAKESRVEAESPDLPCK